MTPSEIRSVLVGLLKNIAPDTEPGKLKPDENIRKTLMIDSFDYLQFIISVDEKFCIETPEEDYGKIETMESLTNYLTTRKSQHSADAKY